MPTNSLPQFLQPTSLVDLQADVFLAPPEYVCSVIPPLRHHAAGVVFPVATQVYCFAFSVDTDTNSATYGGAICADASSGSAKITRISQ
jgi:hypothetical protein